MSMLLILGIVSMFAVVLVWTLCAPKREQKTGNAQEGSLDELTRQHATYFGVIRQAMSAEDLAFLATRGPLRLVRRTHKERQRIAMLYLGDLRTDFERLLRLARVIAVLSPEVAASHEFERLRLTARFSWRFQMVRLGLYAGLLLLPQLSGLSQIVSQLAFRMESAMTELGERAATASELASTLNRSRLDTA